MLVGGLLWIPSAAPLLLSAAVAGALLAAIPGTILGRRIRGRLGGLTAGLWSLWALAGWLAVATDGDTRAADLGEADAAHRDPDS